MWRKYNLIFDNKAQPLFWSALLLLVYVAAWLLQGQLFLNYDVSWLMHAARRLLAGGTYARDFFETNPPLIFYLYLPPVLLTSWLPGKALVLFRGYIFLLASLSLGLSLPLVRKIFTAGDALQAKVFWLTLALVYLILPCFDFGQRDHLLVILALPYLLLVVCRLRGDAFNPYYAAVLGFLAGLGFAIKPHFLLTPLLIELYYAFSKKNSLAWLRPETLVCLATVFIYALSIFIFYPDYIYLIVPYSLRLYYSAVGQPWTSLLLNSTAVYCWVPLLFYFFQARASSYKDLSTVLALALSALLISYFTQRMIHYYHLIPALSLALLLQVVLFGSFLSGLNKRAGEFIFAALLAVPAFVFPVWIFCDLFSSSVAYEKEMLKPLAAFMNTYARGAPVYFFVTAGSYAFPTVDYTASTMAPRFYFLWPAAGLANQALELAQHPGGAFEAQYHQDKNFLVNMIADDLHSHQPRFVFVDQSDDKYRIKDKNFNYLTYFSDNQKFRQEWKNYRFFSLIEEKGIYKLGVYERKKT